MLDLVLDQSIDPKAIRKALDYGKSRGIKIKDVVQALGISQPALHYIMSGKTKQVSLDTLLTIQKMTGYSLVDENFFQPN